jgi:RNA polymerase sigma-70 factor, ECF subfamily
VATSEVVAAVERAHREEWGRVLASVARVLDGDLATAEECTQEAFVAALTSWEVDGLPARPGAWLTTTARRRAIDLVRRQVALRARYPDLARDEVVETRDDEEDAVAVDDRLRLVFTCCHPALAPESRTALTLRMVCGLTTDEIARAFLVPEPTLAARITRAKKKIAAAGIPYRVPSRDDLAERLDGVLTVVHLVFTAGYAAPGPDLVRADLVERALDLGRVLAVLMPDEPEVLGLLALLELTDARRAARVDGEGELVLLEEQDRSRWDIAAVARGEALLGRAMALLGAEHSAGRFLLQAAVAGLHDEAPTFADTDWAAIGLLYDRLLDVWPSPVVAVNRAVAVAFAVGPEHGLAALDAVAGDPGLRGWHYLPAARADLLRRLGRDDEAAAEYRAALALVSDGAERAYLRRRLSELGV